MMKWSNILIPKFYGIRQYYYVQRNNLQKKESRYVVRKENLQSRIVEFYLENNAKLFEIV